MIVTCKIGDKDIKQQILGLNVNGNIVVCGKVTDTNRSKFEIKIAYVYTIGLKNMLNNRNIRRYGIWSR